MGKDLFMYSITLYPEQDDPAALKKFATMHGALLPGWTFLTGDPYDIETIRYRLFRENHIKFDLDPGFHAAKLRIINDATQLLDPCQPVLEPGNNPATHLLGRPAQVDRGDTMRKIKFFKRK